MQIAMGTFIVSFIGNGFVRSAQRSVLLRPIRSEQWRRRLLVLIYFTGIVSLIAIFGGVFLKDIIREGADFVSRLQSDNIWVVVLEKMRHGLGWAIALSWMPQIYLALGKESCKYPHCEYTVLA